MAILPNLAQENADLQAQLAALQAKLAAKARPITFKVTAPKLNPKTGKVEGTSGAISIYGLGRFPITLYRSQMEKFIQSVPEIEAFIEANAALLATKD